VRYVDNSAMLLGMRVLQGMAGGPLLALSQTLLLRIFPKEQSMQAMGLWAMDDAARPVVGPVLGVGCAITTPGRGCS